MRAKLIIHHQFQRNRKDYMVLQLMDLAITTTTTKDIFIRHPLQLDPPHPRILSMNIFRQNSINGLLSFRPVSAKPRKIDT